MQARILFLTDLHKRDVDFTTILGYTNAIDAVQEDIIRFVKVNKVTHIVIGGDWYDKGYRSINRTFNDSNYDRALAESVERVYLCRGNHLFLERDSNPEMYMIQPCPAMPLAHSIKAPTQPIFYSPDTIQMGPLQISLFHYDKDNKNYVADRNPETTFHIGVYHDDVMLPTSIRNISGDHRSTTSDELNHYFANIDLAICNHIHTAVGQVKIPIHGRTVNAFIPGSLCITKNQPSEIHSEVQLPMITLEDDNTVRLQLAKFSLHTEMLKFYKKKETRKDEIDSNFKYNGKSVAVALNGGQTATLKETLIQKGYDQRLLSIIDQAYTHGLAASVAVSILKGEHE